jgi:NAD(P)-dependent dehydrogenase (short-subunit alcohol dehydrogenase family)
VTTRLEGRVVAVAGAGGPAGRAVLRRLAEAGATVAAADADEQRLDAAIADARTSEGSSGGTVAGRAVDLLDAAATDAWVADIEATHGRLDGLVHLVGGWRGAKELTPEALEHWATLEPLLVRTAMHTSLAARAALQRSGSGRFVVVSAQGAGTPTAGNAAYAAAKAAVEAWTLAVADSFTKTESAAAVILVVKALVDDAMKAAKPEAKFAGFTHVDELAEAVARLWEQPTADLNGTRQWMIAP